MGIVTVGVWVVGGDALAHLMMEHGESASTSYAMFDQSIREVLLVAIGVAIVASVGLAIALARMIARPLADVGAAARRVADGDLAARVPRTAPDELASLADSFNQMAAELEESERQRRDIIANTAHELRTPLTNLEGYLEAIRDGIIVPDRADLRLAARGDRAAGAAGPLARRPGGRRPGRQAGPPCRRGPGGAARGWRLSWRARPSRPSA